MSDVKEAKDIREAWRAGTHEVFPLNERQTCALENIADSLGYLVDLVIEAERPSEIVKPELSVCSACVTRESLLKECFLALRLIRLSLRGVNLPPGCGIMPLIDSTLEKSAAHPKVETAVPVELNTDEASNGR